MSGFRPPVEKPEYKLIFHGNFFGLRVSCPRGFSTTLNALKNINGACVMHGLLGD
jgi:hypothetical protein